MADRMFGIPPQLNADLTDLAGVLSQRDGRRVLDAIEKTGARFPQVTFACVITRVPMQVCLPVFTFWLFNRGSLVPPTDKGGGCRLLLLVLDADQGRAACMIGYGLEPFVNDTVLQGIADAAGPALSAQEYAEALIAALACVEGDLSRVVEAIPEGFGLSEVGELNEESAGSRLEVFAY